MKFESVHLDYETRSELDVRKVGAITYAQHPSTEVMCLAWAVGDTPVNLWRPGEPFPKLLLHHMWANTIFKAHNALFEQCITKWVLPKHCQGIMFPTMHPSRWRCSAAKAAACALPRALEDAAKVLNLVVQKDMAGHKLMLKHSKPRSAWKKSGTGSKYFEDPIERLLIERYCVTDVLVERAIDRKLPDLIPFEQRVWVLNQEMNLRGVLIDVDTVKRILDWVTEETRILNLRLKQITYGKVEKATERDKLVTWIRAQGIQMPNLQAATVEKVLSDQKFLNDKNDPLKFVRRALIIRQSVGKSAIKKYPAMLKRVSKSKRIHDFSMYHGASTGRESGRGLQLQNLVKSRWKNFDSNLAIELINNSTLEELKLLYGDVFEVFSGCVRGMITSSPGHDLFTADYNAIEARVLQWMAGDKAGLERFRKKIDSYVLMASKIFGKPVSQITKEEREVGKRAELGAGFGMGGVKFHATCIQYGATNVTLELGKRAINIFRELHPEIPKMWAEIERVAIRAVQKPGRAFEACKTVWVYENDFLRCILPSGRSLRYYKPTIRSEPAPWGDLYPRLYHWSVNPKTKKWENAGTYGGKLTENVVQATARDIMVNAQLNLTEKGFAPMFAVHDEVISEKFIGNRDSIVKSNQLMLYERIMMNLPKWADGLPITAKGWTNKRYRK